MTVDPATTVLAAHLQRGEELLVSARMIGDHHNYDVWHRRRRDWIKSASDALDQVGEQSAVSGFRNAAIAPCKDGDWQDDLRAELDRTRGALEILRPLTPR
jgi:hypothetical protein